MRYKISLVVSFGDGKSITVERQAEMKNTEEAIKGAQKTRIIQALVKNGEILFVDNKRQYWKTKQESLENAVAFAKDIFNNQKIEKIIIKDG